MLLIEYVPADLLASNHFRSFAVIVVASIAVPIALPTFFEIPLALGIIAAGGSAHKHFHAAESPSGSAGFTAAGPAR